MFNIFQFLCSNFAGMVSVVSVMLDEKATLSSKGDFVPGNWSEAI